MSETIQNSSERKSAFGKFLFFFLLSTLFIVGAVYFNVNISNKENSVLNKEVYRYKTYEAAQRKFVQISNDTKHLIDSLTAQGANTVYLNQQIAVQLRQLTDLEYKDSSIFNQLNTAMINSLWAYSDATNKYVSYGDAPQQLENYKQKYDQAQRDLESARQDLDVLRHSINNGTAVQ